MAIPLKLQIPQSQFTGGLFMSTPIQDAWLQVPQKLLSLLA